MITRRTTLGLLAAVALPIRANAESPLLAADVTAGNLPPMAERLPTQPARDRPARDGAADRAHGGTIRMLVGGQRDVRLMPIYGYSRLVGYDANLNLAA